ncbi:hypothetical protein [Saprospira grandis]|uniref:Type II toxin-antitoxin system PemK/MazF family toxin n=1 Tax=Saprospira grandis (strain Lewin) TaxID=984262 RepID=H6L3V9_SAPGL|nr:hypothetical protein [Saprospira grandis]AFC23841.1 hypothetical protein SGRA_1106 [Saprospira grandis str. Lewin]
MSSSFEVGDVVICAVFYEERLETKRRPVVIVEKYNDSSYAVKVTSTNIPRKFPGKYKGRWIEEGSEAYKMMGLRKASFVYHQNSGATTISNVMFTHVIGRYPYIEELLQDLIEENV